MDDFWLETLLPQPNDKETGEFAPDKLQIGFRWRWGLYDHDQQFAVYDKRDVAHIRRLLSGELA